MSYGPQQWMSDPARARAEIWRTVAGVLGIALLSLIFALLWLLPQSFLTDRFGPDYFSPEMSPAGLIWTLSTFICPTLALIVVLRLLHRRGVASLFGPIGLMRAQFLRVLAVQVGVVVLAMVLPSPHGVEITRNLGFGTWLAWLPLAVVMLCIQIGIEELIFRGYLQSQLAARLRSPVIWIGVPAAIFAVLHLDPTAGANRWPVIGVTFAFALAAGDLTARCGTLGPALAMHFVNNFTSLFLVGAAGPLQGMALYILPVDMSDPGLWPSFVAEALIILISWLGARIVLRV